MVGENPYQAPLEVAELVADDQDRNQALARVRFAVIALAVPGLGNWFCLHFVYAPHRFVFGSMIPNPVMNLIFAVANLALAIGAVAVCWFFALKAFECVAVIGHYLTGQAEPLADWMATLYRSLWPLPFAAVVGSALWLLWLGLFFFDRGLPVFSINLLIGGLGHLVAASVYGTVIYNWYRMRTTARSERSSEKR